MLKEDTKKKLTMVAADLQKKTGERVDFDTAISYLIDRYLEESKDWEKFAEFCEPLEKVTKEELLDELYKGRREDEKNLVANDSSCLIALQADEKLAKRINQNLVENWDAYCSEMAILELHYVLCRNSNLKTAQKKVEAFVNSNVIEIIPVRELLKEASRQKCERAIAIADCLTIALAKNINGKAIFYRKETELKNAIKKKPFEVELIFLSEEL